jgi:acetyl esterase
MRRRFLSAMALVAAASPEAWARAYENVEYGRAGEQRLLLDAVVPDGPGPYPAAILVHGGAWVTGDKRQTVQPLFRPLEEARIAWFSINYRLLNGSSLEALLSAGSLATLAAAVDDVRQAIAYVKRHAAEYRIDPGRIALIGESAGAHLTLMAALKPAPGSEVRASVAFYAPSDLVHLAETSNRIPDGVRDMVKGTALGAVLLNGLRELSPRYFVHRDEPPALLIHGTRDGLVPLDQSERLCQAMREAGASCELHTVEGGGHGMRFWSSTAYQRRLTEWLLETLR